MRIQRRVHRGFYRGIHGSGYGWRSGKDDVTIEVPDDTKFETPDNVETPTTDDELGGVRGDRGN